MTRLPARTEGVPGRGGGSVLGFPVADDARHQQVGVVEGRTEDGRERVAQLAALVDHSGNVWGQVPGKASWPGEPSDQLREAGGISGQLWVDVPVAALQPQVGMVGRGAMTRSGHQQRRAIRGTDEPVQPRIHQVDPGAGAPVTQESRLEVLHPKGFPQIHVLAEEDHRRRDVVRCASVAPLRSEISDNRKFSSVMCLCPVGAPQQPAGGHDGVTSDRAWP